MQTHLQSLLESISNTAIGYILSITSYVFVFNIDTSTTLTMTAYFTVLSIIRQYITRRFFNKKGGETT